MECFALNHLSFAYPDQPDDTLRQISLSVRQGEFLVLCGPSGCGKSTLLRQLKSVLTPHGRRTGDVLFEGRPLCAVSQREQASAIGYVLQSPENQIVTDKVWHELAFGPESLGLDTPTIRRRVAEMASFFGIQHWFSRDVQTLSGGQKQLLNLAAVMVMQPRVLILDEPTGQLDPIAASAFLEMLVKINRKLGVTVILSEHRLEEALPAATTVAVLENGRLLCSGSVQEVGQTLKASHNALFAAMPAAMQVWAGVETSLPCPVTVREGRDFLAQVAAIAPLRPLPDTEEAAPAGEVVVSAEDVWFRYQQDGADVLKGLEVSLRRGELLALVGGNGTGKTTALRVLAGLQRPLRGTVHTRGRAGVLPQNPQALFLKKTVREELFDALCDQHLSKDAQTARVEAVVARCELTALLDRHPFDLSGGEQQRAALAKILLTGPEILFLDEPTKGCDAAFKQQFAQLLRALLADGVSVLLLSHDVDFCAQYAHRCALFFDGAIVAEGTPRRFFAGNSFYTTAANRMARQWVPQAVTVSDVLLACGGTVPEEPELPRCAPELSPPKADSPAFCPAPLPLWRKLIACGCAAMAVFVFLYATGMTDLTKLTNAAGLTKLAGGQLRLYGVFVAALCGLALAIGRRAAPPAIPQTKREKRTLSRRTRLAAALIVLCIPLTLFVGICYLGDRHYAVISFAVLMECMLPFFLVFEGRKPKARELVVIAVLCAIGVAGRAAFFMLPQFKPVMALTIVAGVAFGGETGFLVGAVTMLTSNLLFSQGPWTPWQMFCMGSIGFLAGVFFRKGWLRRTRGALACFGAVCAIVIYGGIMNPASALMWSGNLNRNILLTYYLTGFPMDCVHAFATAFFLWIAGEPMLEKLSRVGTKYGLVTQTDVSGNFPAGK